MATHLARSLQKAGSKIYEVYSPKIEHANQFAEQFNCTLCTELNNIDKNTDILLLCIPDDLIAETSKKIGKANAIIAHTSGNTSINSLINNNRYGVFYPLQTFSKQREIDMKSVPICLESSDDDVMKKLESLASSISDSIYQINSRQRKFLHLSAVFVNNFTNHMYHVAEEFLEDRELDFDLLKPLILETAAKVVDIDPVIAQTGPARRGDVNTIKKHLDLLEGNPEYKQLYQLISEQILKKYHE